MKHSTEVKTILSQIDPQTTKLGDLRKMAKEIKIDHELALELWSNGDFLPRQLSILIMDKRLLTQELMDKLDADIRSHSIDERNQLMDWLMANQLAKNKKTISLIESWEDSPSSLQRPDILVLSGKAKMDGVKLILPILNDC